MATILTGIVGGLLGAIVAAAVARATSDDPTPSATVWAMYFGDGDPGHYERQGMAAHVLYGAGAGAAFVLFTGAFAQGLSTPGDAVFWALVWSAVLAVVAVGFWSVVVIGDALGTDLDSRALAELGAGHLVFGVVLGLVAHYAPAF